MLAPNSILQNRYRVIKIIGQGGMGAVYQAIDQRLGCTVAIKQTFFNDDELGQAFEREARLLANLRHPALPKVSDHFIEAGGQFLVMEFIPGDDLAKLLKRQRSPFPPDLVFEWGHQLLDALDYLHRHNPPIIHRDIKPQNLKLTERSQIILLDFGLAKGAPQLLADGTASSLFGYTLNYAPLEQIQSLGTDSRSDLYSLGATLYHLMTAVTPPGSLSRAAAIVTGQPDPLVLASEVNPVIPPSLAHVVSQAMSLGLDSRPSTAYELRMALREAQHQPSGGHPIFGVISPDVVTRTGAEHKRAVVEKRLAFDPTEAPTRLMVEPELYAAPDTVSMEAKPTSRPPKLQDSKARFIWMGQAAALILLTVALFVFLIARILPPQAPPAVETGFPPRPRPPLPPATPPGPAAAPPFAPAMPPHDRAFERPSLILPEGDELRFNKGSVTIRWSPVPGVSAYKVELANSNFSKTWTDVTTTNTSHTIRFSGGPAFVRLTTIHPSGRELVTSRWWEIQSGARVRLSN